MIDEAYAAFVRTRNAARARRRRHGTLTRYDRGCRCAVCCGRNAKACRDYAATLRMLKQFRAMSKAA